MPYAQKHLVISCKSPVDFVGFRLPDGERWQWAAIDAGAVMRFKYGSQVTAILEQQVAPGLSPPHVHPGPDVFVEFAGPIGAQIWVFVSGSGEEDRA